MKNIFFRNSPTFILVLFIFLLTGNSPAAPSFSAGEVINYDIKKVGVKVGEASFTFEGPTTVDGQPAILLVFRSSGPKFYDEERIFLNPQTFYPITVKRDINIFGKKEKIYEYYDHANGKIKIVKEARGRTTEQILKKKGPIENIYGFIYRYRLSGKFNVGESFAVRLPTKDVRIKLIEQTKLNIDGKDIDACLLRTDPKQYSVWLDQNPGHVPLRIDGSSGFGKTSMVLREYK